MCIFSFRYRSPETISALMFMHFGFLASNDFKIIFDFRIFWVCSYLHNVISETRAHKMLLMLYIFIGDDSLVVLIFIKGSFSDALDVHEQIQAVGWFILSEVNLVLHFQCIWNHLGLLLGLVFINLCFLSICLNNWNYKQRPLLESNRIQI